MCNEQQEHSASADMAEATTDKTLETICSYSMQRIGKYKKTEKASSLKERDHKDATDLIMRGGAEYERR